MRKTIGLLMLVAALGSCSAFYRAEPRVMASTPSMIAICAHAGNPAATVLELAQSHCRKYEREATAIAIAASCSLEVNMHVRGELAQFSCDAPTTAARSVK